MRLLTICASCTAALALASPAFAAGGLRTVTVDASQQGGTIRSLQGVSSTPLAGDGSRPDLTNQQHQLGVDFVRTHDIDCSGTGDIDGLGVNRIFPDWNADPDDPAATTSRRPTARC